MEDTASRLSCTLPTWWLWRGGCTRSHSEHGRETPQRRWYFVLRHGRVGRCQVCKVHDKIFSIPPVRARPFWSDTDKFAHASCARHIAEIVDAGWSSPVARQAHNLKVTGSNPVPATKIQKLIQQLMQSPAWLSPAGLLLVSALCPFFWSFRSTGARRGSNSDRNRVW